MRWGFRKSGSPRGRFTPHGTARLGRSIAATLSLVAFGAPASADPAPAADPYGDIIVTAQRRPERAQDVPISLTALSGEALEDMQATEVAALGKVAPSLVMTRTGAFTQPYLRGVGKRSTLGVENSVATYVDGVYLASSISALLDLRGIERVEILNGPQGTLFGRNATGGVIQIVTRDPSAAPSGEAELHVGAYGYLRGDLYVTGGTANLAGNVAMSLSRNGGYGTNLFSGRADQGAVDHSLVGRSKWIWRAAGPLKVTLAADYQDIDQDFSQRPLAGYAPIGAPRIRGFRDGDQDASNRFRFRYGGASVRADATIGRILLTSLSALRRLNARYGTDLDQGPKALLWARAHAVQKQVSQEFQLQSSGASRLVWVAGLYYLRLVESYEPTMFRYGGNYSARLGGRVRQSLSDVGKASSYASYGQATLALGERARLTAGLRYTIEKRSVAANGEGAYDNVPFVRPIPGLPLPRQAPFRNHATARELTWRASLDHRFSDELMGYVSASRGFQSGGWNLQTPQSPPFGPETLDAFEGGFKYVDRTGRFKADASAFLYDYSDLQVSAFTPAGSATTNATSADIRGVDLQAEAQLSAGTGISVGAQLLDARFKRFPNAACIDYVAKAPIAYAPVACDASRNKLPFSPTLKLNAGARQTLSLRGKRNLLLSGNLAYNSGYYSEADNVVRQKAFATLDVSAEWRPLARGPLLRVWAMNLTNAHYHDSLVTFPTAGVLQRPAAPRRFGVSMTRSF